MRSRSLATRCSQRPTRLYPHYLWRGGAGPRHAAAVTRERGIHTVIIPPAPGHFSVLGMLMADLRRDYVQTLFARLNTLSMEQLETQFQQLEAEGWGSPPRLWSRLRPHRV